MRLISLFVATLFTVRAQFNGSKYELQNFNNTRRQLMFFGPSSDDGQKCNIVKLVRLLQTKYGLKLFPKEPKAKNQCGTIDSIKRSASGDTGGRRRHVEDVTAEPDVDIVGMYERNSTIPKQKTSLHMAAGNLGKTCERMKPKWGQVCSKNQNQKEPYRNANWWRCDYRSYVARTECAFIGRGGEVYDSGRIFSAHGVGFRQEGFQPEDSKVGGYHDVVAHHIFAIYPTATGHFFNQLARLFYLVVALPPDVPILVPHFDLSIKLRDILVRAGIINAKKFIMFPSKSRKGTPGLEFKPHFAKVVYFAGEQARCAVENKKYCDATTMRSSRRQSNPGMIAHDRNINMMKGSLGQRGRSWHSLRDEVCSWQLSLPRAFQREVMWCALGLGAVPSEARAAGTPRILIVNRKDSHHRFIKNHDELIAKLKLAVPRFTEMKEFVGTKLSLEEQIRHFAWADIVIAPHGAALGLSVYMQPGGAMVEIGYPQRELPLIFMATALSADLDYYLSIAEKGSHASGLVADVPDVVEVVGKALIPFYINGVAKGRKDAAYNLGNAFANGLGVPQDKMRAMEFLSKAAEMGHKEAMYTIGYVYMKSNLRNEAIKMWQRAASLGHKPAADALTQLRKESLSRNS